jgi:hypothetical protein
MKTSAHLLVIGLALGALAAGPTTAPSNQARQNSGANGANGAVQQLQVVRGSIRDLHVVKLKEVAAKQIMAKVETQNGDTIVANLGNADTMQTRLLRRGDQVQLVGQMGTVNGKDVLFVQSMTAQGATTNPSEASSTQPSANGR